ncbi:MAG: serine--tRNA ligase [Clostridia bacterium]|nr:serine--tRNA ligase [Clostridia bacterium]
MLDIKNIRTDAEKIIAGMNKRNKTIDLQPLLDLDAEKRALMADTEKMKAEQNATSKMVPQYKKEGKDTAELFAAMKVLSDKVKENDTKIKEYDEKITSFLLSVPNIPLDIVPDGKDDSDNLEVRKNGEPTKFDFEPLAHWDIGSALNILDPERAAKVTGARFHFYRGMGAALERAIISFFLDTHTANGYTEIMPPYMVNRKSMTGTGQLPKFEEDAFKTNNDYFLIPTAEVPVTNYHADEILSADQLPIKYCAYSACFRAEAGSAGRDTRGLIRQHQFNKVELVKFTTPEQALDELESLTNDAERVLQLLGLPYRVVRLCGGDLGFSSAITYDIEVWMPSYGRYVEISSCSCFTDFQARRANIKFKTDLNSKEKPRFVYTLNGSGVAVGRTVAAILENYQNKDGSVTIPEALRKYLGGKEVITKQN